MISCWSLVLNFKHIDAIRTQTIRRSLYDLKLSQGHLVVRIYFSKRYHFWATDSCPICTLHIVRKLIVGFNNTALMPAKTATELNRALCDYSIAAPILKFNFEGLLASLSRRRIIYAPLEVEIIVATVKFIELFSESDVSDKTSDLHACLRCISAEIGAFEGFID